MTCTYKMKGEVKKLNNTNKLKVVSNTSKPQNSDSDLATNKKHQIV